MKEWFKALPEDEKERRKDFKQEFKTHYDGFRALRLGTARHISEHRTGVAPVTVTISGWFGVTYTTAMLLSTSVFPKLDRLTIRISRFWPSLSLFSQHGTTSQLKGNPCFPHVGTTSIMREPS